MKEVYNKNKDIIIFKPLKKEDTPKKKNLVKIGNLNSLIAQIPTLISIQQLSGAFRVIIPPGISGKLMQYSDGLLGTTMIKDGKIVGHAGLQSLSGMATPMIIFTAMSIVTGQYFLAQINNSINEVLDEIENIKDILMLKEEANLFSYSVFLKRVFDNYQHINVSKELKIATLTNIQKTINELNALIYFYIDMIIKEIDEVKKNMFKEDIKTIDTKKYIEKLKVSLDLQSMFLLLEFVFSQSFDDISIKDTKASINKINNDTINIFIKKMLAASKDMQLQLCSVANTLKKQETLRGLVDEFSTINTEIKIKYVENSASNLEKAFKTLEATNNKGVEYFFLDDGVYIEPNKTLEGTF